MKKAVTLFLIAFTLLFVSCQKVEVIKEVQIIPRPQHIQMGKQLLNIDKSFAITFESKILKQEASYFSELLNKTVDLNLQSKLADNFNGKAISLQLTSKDGVPDENYTLSISQMGIVITSNSPKGVFYGLQSLFQIVLANIDKNGKIEIPTLEIIDSPRFAYRGMHLDVGRHLFPPAFIKKYIDLLAFYKLNTFHWHLTEDQGWRIEIKKYPKLTEVGAWRKETLIGHGGKKPFEFDGKTYGGFYTQDEIRDIVNYAAERHISIIPEIEMPGHSLAALASYPELGCTGGPYEVATRWGVFQDIYCTKDETFEFLEDVLLEVMDLFPSKYIHIGGDEAPKARWKECAICQATIKREGLKNEHELQSYFIQRIEKFLNNHGRQIIGWDEILEGGLAPNATVMSWRGTEGGIDAAKQNHDAIMSPGSYCYFDHYQNKAKTEPLAIGGFLPLDKVYSYEPVPEALSPEEAEHILGAQANVWTEYMETTDYVEYMILPRMAALAEVNWAEADKKDWELFKKKVQGHYLLYKRLGYNYCDHSY